MSEIARQQEASGLTQNAQEAIEYMLWHPVEGDALSATAKSVCVFLFDRLLAGGEKLPREALSAFMSRERFRGVSPSMRGWIIQAAEIIQIIHADHPHLRRSGPAPRHGE